MVLLKMLGTEGSGASNPNLRHVFRIGRGTHDFYQKRVIEAIKRLKDKYYNWPDLKERQEIAARFEENFDFPNLVGIADGTLFPMAFTPETDDAGDYKGRKYGHSLTVLIVCDDRRKIRYYYAGWPGSVHDNRVFKNSMLYVNAAHFFNVQEYLLGDSAFDNMWFMVSAFVCLPGRQMAYNHEKFNTAMARPRIISEHCIGILKGRFPYLRSIRKIIKKGKKKKSLKAILEIIEVCVILHNFLIDHNSDSVPEEWIDDDDATDIGTGLPEDSELNQAIPEGAPNDLRRRQLLVHILDR
jgi:hypothetical protein